MEEKYAKLIAKTRDGVLIAVYPEVQCDTEVDIATKTSSKPVANYAIADAIGNALTEAKTALKEAFLGSGLSWDDDAGQGSVNFAAVPAEQAAALAEKLVAEGGSVVLGSDGKLTVDFSKLTADQIMSLCSTNGGIVASTETGENSGKLAIDFSQMPTEQITGIVESMVDPDGAIVPDSSTGKLTVDFSKLSAAQIMALCLAGGGIVSDHATGKLKIDFSAIDADTKRNITSSLKMQVPLSANKTIYVDNVNGNDTYLDNNEIIIEGKGESKQSAFKTIQTAVNFVTEQMALGTKNVDIVLLANEDVPYKEDIVLSEYNVTSGMITIRSESADKRAVWTNASPVARQISCSGGSYILYNLDLNCKLDRANNGRKNYSGLISVASYGDMTLRGCHCKCEYNPDAAADPKLYSVEMFTVSNYGALHFGIAGGTHNVIEYHKNNAGKLTVILCANNGLVDFNQSGNTEETVTVDIPVADESSFNTLLEDSQYSTLTAADSETSGNRLLTGKLNVLNSFINAFGLDTSLWPYLASDSMYVIEAWGECTTFCHVELSSLVRGGSGGNYQQRIHIPKGKTATGKRYDAKYLGGILINGVAGSFPGNVAGTADAATFAYAKTAVDG